MNFNRRSEIEKENLEAAVNFFSKKLVSFEKFEASLFCKEGQDPTKRYIAAKRAFEKAKVSHKLLFEWADKFVNKDGWQLWSTLVRQNRRKARKKGAKKLVTREFSEGTMKELHEVRVNISEKKEYNIDETIRYLINYWKDN